MLEVIGQMMTVVTHPLNTMMRMIKVITRMGLMLAQASNHLNKMTAMKKRKKTKMALTMSLKEE